MVNSIESHKNKYNIIGAVLAAIVMLVVSISANTTCVFFIHQPKVPEELR